MPSIPSVLQEMDEEVQSMHAEMDQAMQSTGCGSLPQHVRQGYCTATHPHACFAVQEMDEELQSTHASNTEMDQANGDLRNQLTGLRQEGHQTAHQLRMLSAQHRRVLSNLVLLA